MIRLILPAHLCELANTGREVEIEVESPASVEAVLEALERRYPMLRGTLRDQVTKVRRPFIRFFALGEDLTHEPADAPLPEAVQSGKEALRIVGAMAGG